MIFLYKAKNLNGETVDGIVEALNQEAAIDVLAAKQLIILSLKEKGATTFWQDRLGIFQKAKPADLVFLSRQLAVMVTAGLPLVRALEVLGKQTANLYLKGVVEAITEDVRGGSRFSSALAKYPKIFDDFYINMVRVGETAGKLDEILNYLADESEKNFDLQNKIKGAMIYPAFVLCAVAGVLTLMMLFVVPQLTSILKEANVTLPLTTQLMINVSNFFKTNFIYILIFIIVLIIVLRYLLKTKTGRLTWDRIVLRLPIFGPLFRNFYLVRLCRSLATLIMGGVILTSALKITSDVTGSSIYKAVVLEAIKDVEEGRSISGPFLKSPFVPKMVSHLLVVGEETGKLDEILDKLANFYTREMENILSRMVTLLEPIIIIFLGVIVGGVVASIILPMYRLAAAF